MQLQLTLGAGRVQRDLRDRHSETEVWTTANVTTGHTRGLMVGSIVFGGRSLRTALIVNGQNEEGGLSLSAVSKEIRKD